MAYLATVRHCHWTRTCMLISPCTQPPCTQVEEKLTSMYNNQRKVDGSCVFTTVAGESQPHELHNICLLQIQRR